MLVCLAMLITVVCSRVAKQLELYINVRYSSCVTDAPLNLLVTALDGRCDAVVRCVVLSFDRVVLRSNSLQPLFAFQCLSPCVLPGYRRRRCECAIDFTFGTDLLIR